MASCEDLAVSERFWVSILVSGIALSEFLLGAAALLAQEKNMD